MVEGYRLNVVDRSISWRAPRFEAKGNRLQMIILEVAMEEFLSCCKSRKTGTTPPQVGDGWGVGAKEWKSQVREKGLRGISPDKTYQNKPVPSWQVIGCGWDVRALNTERIFREIVPVSLNFSLKRRSVRETALGNLPANLIHLSKCLSKTRRLSL